jgi:hypothetical protein
VRQWFATPSSNNGLLVRGGAGSPGLAKYRFSSSEEAINKPEVVIYWTEATSTPTPTPTATPTATATATPTATPTNTSTPTATPTPWHMLYLPAIIKGPR